jgi:hypothetical protein
MIADQENLTQESRQQPAIRQTKGAAHRSAFQFPPLTPLLRVSKVWISALSFQISIDPRSSAVRI